MSGRQAKGHRKATITEARKVCEEHGARQVIVLLFDGEQVSGVSYGATKAECAAVGRTLDSIVDGLRAARIALPNEGGPPVFAIVRGIDELQRRKDAAERRVQDARAAFGVLYNDAIESAVPGHSTVQTVLLEEMRKAVSP